MQITAETMTSNKFGIAQCPTLLIAQHKATFRNTCEAKKVEILKIKRERHMHKGFLPPRAVTDNIREVRCAMRTGPRDS